MARRCGVCRQGFAGPAYIVGKRWFHRDCYENKQRLIVRKEVYPEPEEPKDFRNDIWSGDVPWDWVYANLGPLY